MPAFGGRSFVSAGEGDSQVWDLSIVWNRGPPAHIRTRSRKVPLVKFCISYLCQGTWDSKRAVGKIKEVLTAEEQVKGLGSVAGICLYLKQKKYIFFYSRLDIIPDLLLFQWLMGSLPLEKTLRHAPHISQVSDLWAWNDEWLLSFIFSQVRGFKVCLKPFTSCA